MINALTTYTSAGMSLAEDNGCFVFTVVITGTTKVGFTDMRRGKEREGINILHHLLEHTFSSHLEESERKKSLKGKSLLESTCTLSVM